MAQEKSLLGIDFDPETLKRYHARGYPALYGDVSDPEFLLHLPYRQAEWVIMATPPQRTGVIGVDQRVALIQTLRDAGYTGRIAVTSHDLWDARQMVKAGADVVLNPFSDGAARAVEKITGQPVRQEEEIFGAGQAS
ncbi:NAD-binding protein [Fodinicurvata halophila]